MHESRVIVVGGGPAGLTTAGALKQVGIDAVILDRGERTGQSWEERYDHLHLHTVRAYSGLAHYPIPLSYPKYLSQKQYASYLREYAAHFNLQVMAQTEVTQVRQDPADGRMDWTIETGAETWIAQVVVMATGQFGKPFTPQWLGLEEFAGEKMHSAAYRSGHAFAGQQVLVIGAGNSGVEIAADLAEQGAGVSISIRTAPPVVPRDFLGTPAQVFGILMHSFPPAISDRVGRTFSRIAFGDLRAYGLAEPAWLPFATQCTPVIDVGFVPALKAGKISIRPDVRQFTRSGVYFIDGQEAHFDAVIFATGFKSGLSQLLQPANLLDAKGNPRFASGTVTSYPGLYFMGFFDSLRGFLFESNLASQRLAREIKRYFR
jgi:hypothetical protein